MAPTVSIDFTYDELDTLLAAMIDKIVTDRGRAGLTELREPSPADLCCDYHRLRYERDQELARTLADRLVRSSALADRLEAVIQTMPHPDEDSD